MPRSWAKCRALPGVGDATATTSASGTTWNAAACRSATNPLPTRPTRTFATCCPPRGCNVSAGPEYTRNRRVLDRRRPSHYATATTGREFIVDGEPTMVRRAGLGLALAVLALAGCTASQQEAKYRVAVIPKGLTHEFWQSIHRGAERAAADLKEQHNLDVKVVWDGPNKESDTQEQI